jgi:mono/diheme cytochrome c family protein
MGVRSSIAAPKPGAAYAAALLLFTTVAVASSSSDRRPVRVADGQKTTKDGVYTKAQADKMAETYAKVCANCHDPAKVPEGKKPGPPLTGDAFFDNWKDRTVGELMTTIRLTMPNDGSMTLTAEDAADLTAYILQMNKLPEGKEPLKNDDVAKKTVIVK